MNVGVKERMLLTTPYFFFSSLDYLLDLKMFTTTKYYQLYVIPIKSRVVDSDCVKRVIFGIFKTFLLYFIYTIHNV